MGSINLILQSISGMHAKFQMIFHFSSLSKSRH